MRSLAQSHPNLPCIASPIARTSLRVHQRAAAGFIVLVANQERDALLTQRMAAELTRRVRNRISCAASRYRTTRTSKRRALTSLDPTRTRRIGLWCCESRRKEPNSRACGEGGRSESFGPAFLVRARLLEGG